MSTYSELKYENKQVTDYFLADYRNCYIKACNSVFETIKDFDDKNTLKNIYFSHNHLTLDELDKFCCELYLDADVDVFDIDYVNYVHLSPNIARENFIYMTAIHEITHAIIINYCKENNINKKMGHSLEFSILTDMISKSYNVFKGFSAYNISDEADYKYLSINSYMYEKLINHIKDKGYSTLTEIIDYICKVSNKIRKDKGLFYKD